MHAHSDSACFLIAPPRYTSSHRNSRAMNGRRHHPSNLARGYHGTTKFAVYSLPCHSAQRTLPGQARSGLSPSAELLVCAGLRAMGHWSGQASGADAPLVVLWTRHRDMPGRVQPGLERQMVLRGPATSRRRRVGPPPPRPSGWQVKEAPSTLTGQAASLECAAGTGQPLKQPQCYCQSSSRATTQVRSGQVYYSARV